MGVMGVPGVMGLTGVMEPKASFNRAGALAE
jgi:hypothetical protein